MPKLAIGTNLGSYSFNKATKQITFSGFTPVLRNILAVIDTTNQTVIYNCASPSLGGTLSGSVLTLTYDTNTGAFNNADELHIVYFNGTDPQLTSLLSLLPSSIGKKADADSLSVALSTEAYAALDTVGTATSAIDGRLENGFGIFGNKAAHVGELTTELNSLASSSTAGYLSGRIDLTGARPDDIFVHLKVDFANSTPTDHKALYLFAVSWYYDGTNWFVATGGTSAGSIPPATKGAYTISEPNQFRLCMILSHTTQGGIAQDNTLLSNIFGRNFPDGVSFFILNRSGAALETGNLLGYKMISRVLLG